MLPSISQFVGTSESLQFVYFSSMYVGIWEMPVIGMWSNKAVN